MADNDNSQEDQNETSKSGADKDRNENLRSNTDEMNFSEDDGKAKTEENDVYVPERKEEKPIAETKEVATIEDETKVRIGTNDVYVPKGARDVETKEETDTEDQEEVRIEDDDVYAPKRVDKDGEYELKVGTNEVTDTEGEEEARIEANEVYIPTTGNEEIDTDGNTVVDKGGENDIYIEANELYANNTGEDETEVKTDDFLDKEGKEETAMLTSGKDEITIAEDEKVEEAVTDDEEETQPKLDVLSSLLNRGAADFKVEDADRLYHDNLNEMTWGRRWARFLSVRYDWYDPSKKREGENAPILDAAWSYFEHSTLPRHFLKGSGWRGDKESVSKSFVQRKKKTRDLIQRAEYGEREEKTQLYNVWMTPESELADFGIAVGIYFWTLRVLAIITFIAGLISIPNMMYFASNEYGQSDVKFGLKGSAVCSDQQWVACPTCTRSDWDGFPSTYSRFATALDGSVTFILRNNCAVRFSEGIVACVTLGFVCISIAVMNFVSRRREVRFDESQQTASDYSVAVVNPPPDAFDPEEWKEFFAQADHGKAKVSLVTVTIDNEELIRTLVKRRQAIRSIYYSLKPGIKFDPNDLERMAANCLEVATWQKYLCCANNADGLLAKVRALETRAKEITSEEMKVSNIFVTFDTEKSQRAALNALSASGLQRLIGGRSIPDELKFNGRTLQVVEPAEPSSIRWHDLDETFSTQVRQFIVSYAATFSFIALGAYLVALAGRKSPVWASLTVTAINQVTPRICKSISHVFETHSNDGSRQASLYIKMTIFKWVNTAIVTALITPFVYTADPNSNNLSLMTKVYTIFFAELLTNPLLMISDFWGHIQRHILGPRAPDQERMNLAFGGGLFLVSLRYTEMTKILFLTFFYSAIYPAGFFFAAASLTVNYFVDKFCLLRTYGSAPQVGKTVAQFSRAYFFTSALAVYALMLSYNYAGFPFDNVCDTEETVPADYVGTFAAINGKDGPANVFAVTIEEGDNVFSFCLQDMLRFSSPRAFPALPQFQKDGMEWMSDDQEQITRLTGSVSVAVIGIVTVFFVYRLFLRPLLGFFFKPYKPEGRASEQRFSELKERYGYIPQVKQRSFQYPLLACNIEEIDSAFVDWSDPSEVYPYDKHNLIYDIPGLADNNKNPIYSIIKSWEHRKDLHRD